MSFANAIGAGFNADTVLKHLGQRFPEYAAFINTAQAMGFSPNRILRKLDQTKNKVDYDEDQYLTDFEKSQKSIQKSKKENVRTMFETGAGLALAGGAGLAARAAPSMARSAIQASEVLPAAEEGGAMSQTTGALLKQLPGPGSISSPKVTQSGPSPAPQGGGALVTPYAHNPRTNINIIRKTGLSKKFDPIIGSGLPEASALSALNEAVPKKLNKILEKAPGGREQALKDYYEFQKGNLSQRSKEETFKKFHEKTFRFSWTWS